MTEPCDPELRTLAAGLSAGDAAVRLDAAERLSHAGEAAAPVAVPLVRACADPDEGVRDQVVATLEDLGVPPPETIAGLVELSAASDPLVAYWAITLLGRSGQAASGAVIALTRRLAPGTDPAVAQRAAWALGRIGPAAAAAAEPLRQAAASPDPRLARLAQEALSAVGG